ncbi:regulator of nonsense transcripts 3 [Pelomyxa schiedti]|nr:regulator of nonsense transcripts 3 [Pelomyxa schiedti]
MSGGTCGDEGATVGPRLKIVVRKLPHNLKKEAFLAAVAAPAPPSHNQAPPSPLPQTATTATPGGDAATPATSTGAPRVTHNFAHFYYVPGSKLHHRHSRAYITFKTEQELITFHGTFHNHLFVGPKGSEERAQVEYAPYQKSPTVNKVDEKEGTIDTDPDFTSFVERQQQPQPVRTTVLDDKDKPTEIKEQLSPLVEYLLARRSFPPQPVYRVSKKNSPVLEGPTTTTTTTSSKPGAKILTITRRMNISTPQSPSPVVTPSPQAISPMPLQPITILHHSGATAVSPTPASAPASTPMAMQSTPGTQPGDQPVVQEFQVSVAPGKPKVSVVKITRY